MTQTHTRIVGAAGIALLSACAAPRWDKPGGTDQELQRDLAACRIQAAKIPRMSSAAPPTYTYQPTSPGAGLQSGAELQDSARHLKFMDDCLTAKGWARVRK